jgi:hypothetical protein
MNYSNITLLNPVVTGQELTNNINYTFNTIKGELLTILVLTWVFMLLFLIYVKIMSWDITKEKEYMFLIILIGIFSNAVFYKISIIYFFYIENWSINQSTLLCGIVFFIWLISLSLILKEKNKEIKIN